MYFGLIGVLLGAALGWLRAGKAGGNRLDKLQYAAAHATGLGLLGLAFAMLLGWLL